MKRSMKRVSGAVAVLAVAAALALCILSARETGSELLGVMHCASSPWGVGAIRSILR